MGEKEVAFFDLFASPPTTFEADALKVIQQGLDRGIEPSLIQRAARFSRPTSSCIGIPSTGRLSRAGRADKVIE